MGGPPLPEFTSALDPSADENRTTRDTSIDRLAARVVAVGGLLLIIVLALGKIEEAQPLNLWDWAHCLLAALFLAVAVSPRWMTDAQMQACMIFIPLCGGLLQVTTFVARPSVDIDALWDDTWLLTGVYLAFLMLKGNTSHYFLRANMFALIFAALPPLSYWLAFNEFVPELIVVIAVQFSNVGFAILLSLFLQRMHSYANVQRRWKEREAAAAAASARLVEQRESARIAHDRVMSVLNAAAMLTGPTPPELAESARASLSLFERTPPEDEPDRHATDVQSLIKLMAHKFDPKYKVDLSADASLVPAVCADAVIDACAEAMRNSVRHAPDAERRLAGFISADRISVTISDNGLGFNPRDIAEDRMGVRGSLLGRMQDVPGGALDIQSGAALGTTVTVTVLWERP